MRKNIEAYIKHNLRFPLWFGRRAQRQWNGQLYSIYSIRLAMFVAYFSLAFWIFFNLKKNIEIIANVKLVNKKVL